MMLLLLIFLSGQSLGSNVYPVRTGNNITFVNPDDCESYCKCNGVMVNKECGLLSNFDPIKRKCVFSLFQPVNCSGVAKEKDQCYKGSNQLYMDPKDCSRYYKCEGNVTVEKCRFFEQFDPATLRCRLSIPFDRVDCQAEQGSRLPTTPKPTPTPQPLKFSCSGKKNGFYADQEDCDSYYICTNGVATKGKCGFLQKFNPRTLKCQVSTVFDPVNCSPDSPKPYACSEDGLFPDVEDCASFYNCTGGKATYEKCGFLKKFDPVTLKCRVSNIFNPVHCGLQETPPKPVPCEQEGLFPNLKDCSSYYNCSGGVLTLKKCGFWEKFDAEVLKCRVSMPFDEVNCSTTTPITQAPFVCEEEGIFPLPGDCSGYFNCSSDSFRREACGFMKTFDPSTLMCRMKFPFERFNCSDEQRTAFTCVSKADGYYPYQKCSGYFTCSENKKTYTDCGLFRRFNSEAGACRFFIPFFHSCQEKLIPLEPDSPTPTTTEVISTTLPEPQFSCLGKDDGHYPDVRDCSQHYICKDGLVSQGSCGGWEMFDSQTNKCLSIIFQSEKIKCLTLSDILPPN